MQWTNEQGQVVKLTGLGDIEITALTVDETSSDDLFRVRCKSMSVSWLSDDNTLYVAPPRGTAVTLTVDGVTVFTGVVATVPTKQPYNYRYETYTVYCDDTLTRYKYAPYTTQSATIATIFATYLNGYTYTPANGIDINTTYIDLDALTDTTTTVYDMLTEVCKLLNVEIVDGAIKSPITGDGVEITPSFATTQLGQVEAIQSAEIQVQETHDESTSDDTVTEVAEHYTWGPLQKWRGAIARDTSTTASDTWRLVGNSYRGLFAGLKFDEDGYVDMELIHSVNTYAQIAQYWREGTLDGATYDDAKEIQVAIDKKDHTYTTAVVGLPTDVPTGSPTWELKTLVNTSHLWVGADGVVDLFEDLDRQHVYFTKKYAVSVPPVTTYKPQTWLVINLNINLFPMVGVAAGLSDLPVFSSDWQCKYYNVGGSYQEQAALTIRLYDAAGNLLVGGVKNVTVRLDMSAVNVYGAKNAFSDIREKVNNTWDTGINESGYCVAFDYNYIKDAATMEVDFKGIGGFIGAIYNNLTGDGSTLTWQYASDGMTKPKTLQIPSYAVAMSFAFASGYLEEPEEEPALTPETAADGTQEATHYFFWEQQKGTGNVTVSNRLNSLIDFAGVNTVRVADGYLREISSTIYAGNWLTEQLQLATIIDQRGRDSGALTIETTTLIRVAEYNTMTWRAIGYSYDAITGRWRVDYRQRWLPTRINSGAIKWPYAPRSAYAPALQLATNILQDLAGNCDMSLTNATIDDGKLTFGEGVSRVAWGGNYGGLDDGYTVLIDRDIAQSPPANARGFRMMDTSSVDTIALDRRATGRWSVISLGRSNDAPAPADGVIYLMPTSLNGLTIKAGDLTTVRNSIGFGALSYSCSYSCVRLLLIYAKTLTKSQAEDVKRWWQAIKETL